MMTETKTTQIVIVEDGESRWGVERARLVEALEAQGWEIDDATSAVHEPVSACDHPTGWHYGRLCESLEPAPGYGVGDYSESWDDLPMMSYDPQRGVWTTYDAGGDRCGMRWLY